LGGIFFETECIHTLSPVSTSSGGYTTSKCNQADYRSSQPCILPGSLNWVLALIGWGKDGNVNSAGWQVTLSDLFYGTW